MAKFCYSGPSNNAISQDTEGPPNFRFNQVSKHSRKTEAHGFELEIGRVLKEIFWCKIGSNITSQHLPFSFSKAKIEILNVKWHITLHSIPTYFWLKKCSHYTVDVLWCQPIKLIHFVSTSEFHEYWWNDFDFIFFVPSI